MNKGFNSQSVPEYRLLSEDQILELHQSTLELLENTGVKVMHPEARKLLQAAGCQVNEEDIVKIPGSLVEKSIKSTPSSVNMYNRNGDLAMELTGRNVYYGMGTDLFQTWDLETSELRDSCLQDVVNAAIVGDWCPEIDFIASSAYPREIEPNLAFISTFKALTETSPKPIYFTAGSAADLAVIIQLAETICGGEEQLRQKPYIIHYAEPISPLVHSAGALEKLFLCAKKGIPLNYVPALLSGGSGPITWAGAIITANAEALSGLVIQQLCAEGSPAITGFSVTPLDMRTGVSSYGSPDECLTQSACCDLYHYYGLPVWGEAGCSDSICLDEQASMEYMVQILFSAFDGCNLVHDIGYLGQGLVGSPAALVMCDEIISYVRRITRGLDLSKEAQAAKIIDEVGPGGSYLAHVHTHQHFKQEHWLSQNVNRKPPEVWKEKSGKTYGETIIEKTINILKTHSPDRLPDSMARELDRVIESNRELLLKSQMSV